jgi:hypothetical protein
MLCEAARAHGQGRSETVTAGPAADGYDLVVVLRRCSRCRAVLQTATGVLCAACVAIVPAQRFPGPSHLSGVALGGKTPIQVTIGPPKRVVDPLPSDDQIHDHREYNPNSLPSSESGASGGAVASFTSTPGIAVPGRTTPGVPMTMRQAWDVIISRGR